MELMTDILENELKNAVEVKDPQSLHRYVSYLSENIITKQECSEENNSLRSDIKAIIIEMREGFNRVDKRFEDMQHNMDKRFEDMNRRFDMQYRFVTIGFAVLATMMTIYQFLG